MVRFRLNPDTPSAISEAQRVHLDAMTDANIMEGAESDGDNPPLSRNERSRMETARTVRRVRARTGLSQTGFARTFHINVGRLRDLEQGRTTADSALLAYLRIIDREPDLVKRALG